MAEGIVFWVSVFAAFMKCQVPTFLPIFPLCRELQALMVSIVNFSCQLFIFIFGECSFLFIPPLFQVFYKLVLGFSTFTFIWWIIKWIAFAWLQITVYYWELMFMRRPNQFIESDLILLSFCDPCTY